MLADFCDSTSAEILQGVNDVLSSVVNPDPGLSLWARSDQDPEKSLQIRIRDQIRPFLTCKNQMNLYNFILLHSGPIRLWVHIHFLDNFKTVIIKKSSCSPILCTLKFVTTYLARF
jgi:hypothetical protein